MSRRQHHAVGHAVALEQRDVAGGRPVVSSNQPQVQFFAQDKDGDTYNWYNFSFPTDPDSALGRGDTYTLEISIEAYDPVCKSADLRFRVQAPVLTPGTVYRTEYFDDVFFKFKDNHCNDAWFPDVLDSTQLPDDFATDYEVFDVAAVLSHTNHAHGNGSRPGQGADAGALRAAAGGRQEGGGGGGGAA